MILFCVFWVAHNRNNYKPEVKIGLMIETDWIKMRLLHDPALKRPPELIWSFLTLKFTTGQINLSRIGVCLNI